MYPKNAVKALSARPVPVLWAKARERGPATARSDQADRHGGVGSGARQGLEALLNEGSEFSLAHRSYYCPRCATR